MKYLLDTCVLLWALEGNTKKLDSFAEIIIKPQNLIFVSIVSYWEIAIKKTLGKISIEDNLSKYIERSGFLWVNLSLNHIDYLEYLPLIHHDPFDRLIIAQSKIEKMQILTDDQKILQYL